MPHSYITLFGSSPQSKDGPAAEYRERVAAVARWSENAGFTGTVVYADNGIVDPWLVAQVIVESRSGSRRWFALQPVYIHPYSAAEMVASLGYPHGRKLHLNNRGRRIQGRPGRPERPETA